MEKKASVFTMEKYLLSLLVFSGAVTVGMDKSVDTDVYKLHIKDTQVLQTVNILPGI